MLVKKNTHKKWFREKDWSKSQSYRWGTTTRTLEHLPSSHFLYRTCNFSSSCWPAISNTVLLCKVVVGVQNVSICFFVLFLLKHMLHCYQLMSHICLFVKVPTLHSNCVHRAPTDKLQNIDNVRSCWNRTQNRSVTIWQLTIFIDATISSMESSTREVAEIRIHPLTIILIYHWAMQP